MRSEPTLNELEGPEGISVPGEGGGIPRPAEDEISILDLVIVVVKHRRRIFVTTIITILIALVLAFVLPVKYTAMTSILPPQQGSSAGSALLSQLGTLGQLASAGGNGGLLKNPNDLEVALLKSRTVEDAVINHFHLADLYHKKRMSQVRDKLEKVVEIEASTKDPLIRISATDTDPQRASELANGYVDEFKKFSATLAVTEASQRRIFFENQLRDSKDNLASAEEELKATQEKTGLLQLDSQTRAAIESAANLRAQVAAKEVQIRGLRTYANGDNPELQVAEEQLAGLQSQLTKIGAAPEGAAPVLPNGIMQQEGLDYVRKLRNVRYYETIYELLARQLEAAKVDEARQGTMVQIVDQAIRPDHHSSPKRTIILLVSVVLGMMIGISWAFASEGIRRISRNPVERGRLDTLREELVSKKQSKRHAAG